MALFIETCSHVRPKRTQEARPERRLLRKARSRLSAFTTPVRPARAISHKAARKVEPGVYRPDLRVENGSSGGCRVPTV